MVTLKAVLKTIPAVFNGDGAYWLEKKWDVELRVLPLRVLDM